MSDIIFFYQNLNDNPTATLYLNCYDMNSYQLAFTEYADMVEYSSTKMIILYSPHVGTDYITHGGSQFAQLSNVLYEIKKYYEGSFYKQKLRATKS